jgi:hypothetical protein
MAHPLQVYLRDHLAGATFGYELVERCRSNNEGTEFEPPLEKLAADIGADREALLGVMDRLGATPSTVRTSLAWAFEKLSRVKPNDRPFSYTPLARMVELETLAIGIVGKRALWRALESVGIVERLEGIDVGALVQRAEHQLQAVEQLRLRAARIAFGDHSAPSLMASP